MRELCTIVAVSMGFVTLILAADPLRLAEQSYDDAYWGIAVAEITDKAALKDLPIPHVRNGVLLTAVYKDGPVWQAQLQPGDVVTTIDKQTVNSAAELLDALKAIRPGETSRWTVFRSRQSRGKKFTRSERFTMKLESRRDFYLSHVVAEEDEFRERKLYYATGANEVRSGTHLSLFIVAKEGQPPSLFLRTHFCGENWLFVRKVDLKVGEKIVTLSPGFEEVVRDNSAGEVWEWFHTHVTGELAELIELIVRGGSAEIRFYGEDFFKDHALEDEEALRFAWVWHAHQIMLKAN